MSMEGDLHLHSSAGLRDHDHVADLIVAPRSIGDQQKLYFVIA